MINLLYQPRDVVFWHWPDYPNHIKRYINTIPRKITPIRAYELLHTGSFASGMKYTPSEFAFLLNCWDTMPGHTTIHDVVVRIAKGQFQD